MMEKSEWQRTAVPYSGNVTRRIIPFRVKGGVVITEKN